MDKRKLCFIYGTRPEIIKLSSLIKLCEKRRIPYIAIHTGQHYSYNMDEIFFRDLRLPAPKYKLHIRSKAPYMQGDHTGRMLIAIERVLLKEMPYSVVVQGDTNTALAGALTAEKISTTKPYTGYDIKVAHVEAGLRSYDRTMPEEINRFIVDHISDYLFVPTGLERDIVVKEGVPEKNVFITGNSVADAIYANIRLAKKKRGLLKKMGLKRKQYILATLHRQESVDCRERLLSIINGMKQTAERLGMPIVFPIHPRTAKKLAAFGIRLDGNIRVMKPVDFLSFIYLEAEAGLMMTDSGGVQEEACILKVPCVTLRNNTERPETVKVGGNVVAGIETDGIVKASVEMFARHGAWKNPFGDGHTAEKILDVLMAG